MERSYFTSATEITQAIYHVLFPWKALIENVLIAENGVKPGLEESYFPSVFKKACKIPTATGGVAGAIRRGIWSLAVCAHPQLLFPNLHTHRASRPLWVSSAAAH